MDHKLIDIHIRKAYLYKMLVSKLFVVFSICAVALACGSDPKVIQPSSAASSTETEVSVEDPASEIHEVVVRDFLHASRYTYLNVTEGSDELWIAIPFTEVKKGERYYYQGGVRMHNFESKEHDRVFETLYLVGGVSKTPDVNKRIGNQGNIDMHGGKVAAITENIEPVEGSTRLAQIFSDPAKYRDQILLVKGQCVKVNRNIMGKNWVHLQDGSKDKADDNLDLTISTQEEVSVGAIVTFEGKIGTDRDFGSGYRYDIIMEDAILIN